MSASLIAPTPVMVGFQLYLKVLHSYFSFYGSLSCSILVTVSLQILCNILTFTILDEFCLFWTLYTI